MYFHWYGKQGIKRYKLYDHQSRKVIFGCNVTFDEDSLLKVILDSSNNTLVFDENSFIDPTIEFYGGENSPNTCPSTNSDFPTLGAQFTSTHPNSTLGTHISNANQKISLPRYFTYSNLVKCGIDSTYHKCPC
jgi:hypothetical protein